MAVGQSVNRAFKVPDLRNRITYTLLMFLVFRIGAHVPVPGIDKVRIAELIGQGTIFGLLDLFAGGALSLFTVFAMSITPYINASIIMQLLTVVVPKLEEWSKEGPEGRRKIGQWTRYGTVLLALLQATGLAIFLRAQGAMINPSIGSMLVVIMALTAGTTFLMWIGERITENGIGNGISLIIFAGIVSRLPYGAQNLLTYLQTGRITIFNLLVTLVLALLIIAAVVWVVEGQRRKIGRASYRERV